MKKIQNILLLVLFALTLNVQGQKTDLEDDLMVGKVKTCEIFEYQFDIADSISHEEFMCRFHQCGFNVERMLDFADSINSKYNRKKSRYYYEYDTMGNRTRIGDDNSVFHWREYDAQGRVLKKFREENHISQEIASNKYDENGLLLEERRLDGTSQYVYDSDGKLMERKQLEGDSVVGNWKFKYDKNGILRKTKGFGVFWRKWETSLTNFDSKGNEKFRKTELKNGRIEKVRTRYKYDKNDSIVKNIRSVTRWIPTTDDETEFWEETDSIGNVTNFANYKVSHSKKKEKFKSETRTIRNEQGYPVRVEKMFDNDLEKYVTNNEYDSVGRLVRCEELRIAKNDIVRESVVEYKYDEFGRLIERTAKGDTFRTPNKTVWKYHKDTEFYSYIGRYSGENLDFVQESSFFFDEKGNCIAHIQWMPKSTNSEYYFRVYKIGYYE